MYSKDFLEYAKSQIPNDWIRAWLAVDETGGAFIFALEPEFDGVYWDNQELVSHEYLRIATMNWLSSKASQSLMLLQDRSKDLFKEKTLELLQSSCQKYDELIDKALNSGALNLEDWNEDEYFLPRIIASAILQIEASRIDVNINQGEISNLKLFL